LPPTVTLTVPPSTGTDCVLKPGPKSAARAGAAAISAPKQQSATNSEVVEPRDMNLPRG